MHSYLVLEVKIYIVQACIGYSRLTMTMKILVVGMLPYDSGKTWASIQLGLSLISNGYTTVYFKPLGASEVWRQFRSFKDSVKMGKLVLEDALKASRILELKESLEAINPVAIYTAPLDVEKYGWNVRMFIDDSTDIRRTSVLVRISECRGELKTQHFLLTRNLERTVGTVRSLILELIKKLKPKPISLVGEGLVEDLLSRGVEAAEKCLKKLQEEYEVVVVESYSNEALPLPIRDLEYVVAASQGKLAVYSGDRYLEAIEAIRSVKGISILTTGEVLRLLKPVRVVEVKPLIEPFKEKSLEFNVLLREVLKM